VKLETLFLICNLIVLPGWALLLLAPRWRWTPRIAMFYAPVLLAFVYIGLFIANFEGLHANYQSFGAVQYAFHSPGLVLAAWVHFLAFDLFTGGWMSADARRLAIPHLAVIPCLVVTFLFGPAGLLLYLTLRSGLRRRRRRGEGVDKISENAERP
jgi:hypothetical protein